MAEVVGVVASGISIASLVGQIASSVTKLKTYWDEVKEAPEDVRLLIEEIEDLYLLLYDIEDDQRRNAMSSKILDGASASRCLEHCKRGADSLKELTDDLATEVNAPDKLRRKWASAKVVFKKDKIGKYKSRLERAIRLLSLSHQCYTRALLQLQPDIIVSRISHTMNTLQNDNNAMSSPSTTAANKLLVTACQSHTEVYGSQDVQFLPSGSQYTKQVSKRRLKKREELVARYRVPVWAMKRAWDVEFFRSRSGWTVGLNCINIIPWDSPVRKAILRGDPRALQGLFETGQASIFDRAHVTISGRSEYATLLELYSGNGLDTPISYLIMNGFHRISDVRAGTDMASLMINVYDAEFMIRDLELFRGPKEAFMILQQYTECPYYETTLETRVETALGLARDAPDNSPELFRIAFSMHPGPIPPAATHCKSWRGETLLNAVASGIGATMAKKWVVRQCTDDDLLGWRALLRELITNRADLHADYPAGPGSLTPFLNLLDGAIERGQGIKSSQWLDQLLKVWLEDLDACGVDLLEYGRKEKALHEEILVRQDFEVAYFKTGERGQFWRLIGFSFGASPSDWHIWGSESSDDFAGDFWSMIEPPELSVPGAWIE